MGALLLLLLAALTAPPVGKAERRCGWLDNPTPGNWSLVDRHGEWLLSVQGGYEAPGMDRMPDMSTAGEVLTNGNYGYSCACMTVVTDRVSTRVARVISARPVPLRKCSMDPHLPRR